MNYIVESMLKEILEVVLVSVIIFFACMIIKFVFYDFLEKHFAINVIITVIIPLLVIISEILILFL